jgi:hypothetical protein
MVHPPRWGWMFVVGLLLLSYISNSVKSQFWLTVIVTAVVIALHPLLLHFCSRRRAALTLATVMVPAVFIGSFGLSYQDHWPGLTGMVSVIAYFYFPRRHIWLKGLRRG